MSGGDGDMCRLLFDILGMQVQTSEMPFARDIDCFRARFANSVRLYELAKCLRTLGRAFCSLVRVAVRAAAEAWKHE